jgi:hypothetical protein
VSDLPSVRRIPANLIHVAEDSDAFVELTLLALASPPEEDLARQRIAYAVSQNWDARAREFLSVIAD